ncbi:IS110 family transposase, partial [Paenibacillus elgii]|nr:IS110 family transposase [Paenibacillus elgii]
LALLDAIVNGEVLDPDSVKGMVFTQLKKKVPELIEALNGRVRIHHRFMIGRHLEHMRQVEKHIEALHGEIDRLLMPYRKEMDLL